MPTSHTACAALHCLCCSFSKRTPATQGFGKPEHNGEQCILTAEPLFSRCGSFLSGFTPSALPYVQYVFWSDTCCCCPVLCVGTPDLFGSSGDGVHCSPGRTHGGLLTVQSLHDYRWRVQVQSQAPDTPEPVRRALVRWTIALPYTMRCHLMDYKPGSGAFHVFLPVVML